MSDLRPDRGRPYTVRHMTNAVGADVYHVIARDGFSIIATCYHEQEARDLAESPTDWRKIAEEAVGLAEEMLRIAGPGALGIGRAAKYTEALANFRKAQKEE